MNNIIEKQLLVEKYLKQVREVGVGVDSITEKGGKDLK